METIRPRFTSPYFQLEQVAEGVYAAIVIGGTGAWGNAGIVDLGNITLLFDTFFTPPAAYSLRKAAEALTGRPATYVINSHCHSDHVFGNQVFDDATIVSTTTTYTLMSTRLPTMLEDERTQPTSIAELRQRADDPRSRQDIEVLVGDYQAMAAALPTLTLRLPDLTFEQRLLFHGTQRSAELLTFGGGHTPSDAFLYLPDLSTAFTGDLVQVNFHPSMGIANPTEWLRILTQLETLNLQHIIPGHGPVGTGEHISIMHNYLLDLRQLVTQDAGLDRTTLDSIAIPAKYTAWSAYPVFRQNLHILKHWYAQTGQEHEL